MSAIQLSNIHLDSTGNNRIHINASSNSFVLKVGNSSHQINSSVVFVGNSTQNATANSSGFYKNGTAASAGAPGDYVVLPAFASAPAGTLLTETGYDKASYSTLVSTLSSRSDFPYVGKWISRTSNTVTTQYAATYGNGVYIVAGVNTGFVQTSTDAITWTTRATANNLFNTYSLEYGNGVYVATGAGIQSSTDAITWTNRTSANTNFIQEVAYGNGVFVAVGNAGSVQSSTNGTTWTNRTSTTTQPLYTVSYGNGVFVAAGASGSSQTSTNGTSWTSRTSPNTSATLVSSAYGNGVYAISSYFGFVHTTTNFTNWTTNRFSSNLNSFFMTYNNGLFIAAGYRYTSTIYGKLAGAIEQSTDAITWQPMVDRDFELSLLYALAAGNNKMVASGFGGYIYSLNSIDVNTQFKLRSYIDNASFKEYVRY